MKRRALPKYVTEFRDRHGKVRLRFRRAGFKPHYFRAEPWTAEFQTEYDACMAGALSPALEAGAARTIPGSFDDLIARFYRSPEWLSPSDRTREVYRGVIELFRAEHGKRLVKEMRVQHVQAVLARKAATPTAANILRKMLRRLMGFAVQLEWRTDNPVEQTKPYPIKSEGFHTWTEDDIAAFEARHPIGTRARLAFALMLYTAQRRSDIVTMGRQHIEGGRIRVRQQKTKTPLRIPLHPKLAEIIAATPSDNLTMLTTAHGKPFTSAGFGNWFRDRCDEAGLPDCTAHGLRKAAARRLAEAGCSNQEIKAITGHKTDAEVARYTREADQVALAEAAIRKVTKAEMANPSDGLDKSGANAMKSNG